MVKEPEVDCYHVVNKNEIAQLCAARVAAILAKQFDLSRSGELVELVKGDAGHAAFVLLARTIDIEVAKTHDLSALAGLQALKPGAAFAPQTLVKQQLGVAIDVEWAFAGRFFPEATRAAVGGGAGGVQEPRATS